MAWWRRTKKPAPVSVSVFDRSVAAGPFQRPGLIVGGRQLPPITVRSATDRIAEQTRESHPPGTGTVDAVVNHSVFAADGSTVHMGLGDRAAILIRLTPDMRADLYGLGEAITVTETVSLYLDGHSGFLRASLLIPGLGFDLDTGMLLSTGDVQEFLLSAYTTETVELHISHSTHDRLLAFTCAAPGIRAVLDASFDLITRPAPADLRAGLTAVNNTLNPSALVQLRVTGPAELAILAEIEV